MASRVDFYILRASGADARSVFACRLTEKAYKLSNSVHLRVPDRDSAARLDDLLWTFRDGSFVPHQQVHGDGEPIESPVTIGTSTPAGSAPDLLINLGPDLPADANAFARVAEIVTSDDDSKRRGRQHFAAYRDAGHTLETHKL